MWVCVSLALCSGSLGYMHNVAFKPKYILYKYSRFSDAFFTPGTVNSGDARNLCASSTSKRPHVRQRRDVAGQRLCRRHRLFFLFFVGASYARWSGWCSGLCNLAFEIIVRYIQIDGDSALKIRGHYSREIVQDEVSNVGRKNSTVARLPTPFSKYARFKTGGFQFFLPAARSRSGERALP